MSNPGNEFLQNITHPSHPSHPLTLLTVCSYPGGLFTCDACKRTCNDFSYRCHACNFDLHVGCASLPLTFEHYSHTHPLSLTFAITYNSNSFTCDICSKDGSMQWVYRCHNCNFDAHLHCAIPSQFQVAGQASGGIYNNRRPSLPVMSDTPSNQFQAPGGVHMGPVMHGIPSQFPAPGGVHMGPVMHVIPSQFPAPGGVHMGPVMHVRPTRFPAPRPGQTFLNAAAETAGTGIGTAFVNLVGKILPGNGDGDGNGNGQHDHDYDDYYDDYDDYDNYYDDS